MNGDDVAVQLAQLRAEINRVAAHHEDRYDRLELLLEHGVNNSRQAIALLTANQERNSKAIQDSAGAVNNLAEWKIETTAKVEQTLAIMRVLLGGSVAGLVGLTVYVLESVGG